MLPIYTLLFGPVQPVVTPPEPPPGSGGNTGGSLLMFGVACPGGTPQLGSDSGSGGGGGGDGSGVRRDDAALVAAREIIRATNAFQMVEMLAQRPYIHIPTDTLPACTLWLSDTPDAGDVVSEAVGGGDYTIDHKAEFGVMIAVRDDDNANSVHRLKRLDSIVRKAINKSDLNGTVFGDLTRLRPGRPDPSGRFPNYVWFLTGTFTYFLDESEESRDTTNLETFR